MVTLFWEQKLNHIHVPIHIPQHAYRFTYLNTCIPIHIPQHAYRFTYLNMHTDSHTSTCIPIPGLDGNQSCLLLSYSCVLYFPAGPGSNDCWQHKRELLSYTPTIIVSAGTSSIKHFSSVSDMWKYNPFPNDTHTARQRATAPEVFISF